MRIHREHWYSGILEALQMYIPGNKLYHTMPAKRARTGTLFILPFIIGFLFFMVRPLILSLQMSLNEVNLIRGGGFTMTWNDFYNYHYALQTDPNFNEYLVQEIGRMAINTIATLVLSFVIAVILNQKFKGRILCRIIFFLPVILSSGVLPGIESSNEFFNMMTDIGKSVEESSGVNVSLALQELLQVSGVAGDIFDVVFQMIDAIYDIVMSSGIQIIVFLSGLQAAQEYDDLDAAGHNNVVNRVDHLEDNVEHLAGDTGDLQQVLQRCRNIHAG